MVFFLFPPFFTRTNPTRPTRPRRLAASKNIPFSRIFSRTLYGCSTSRNFGARNGMSKGGSRPWLGWSDRRPLKIFHFRGTLYGGSYSISRNFGARNGMSKGGSEPWLGWPDWRPLKIFPQLGRLRLSSGDSDQCGGSNGRKNFPSARQIVAGDGDQCDGSNGNGRKKVCVKKWRPVVRIVIGREASECAKNLAIIRIQFAIRFRKFVCSSR